jgi:hypothetical protein
MLASGFLFSWNAQLGAVKTVPEKIKLSQLRPDGFLTMLYSVEERPILTNKNSNAGPDDLDAKPGDQARAHVAIAPGRRFALGPGPTETPRV